MRGSHDDSLTYSYAFFVTCVTFVIPDQVNFTSIHRNAWKASSGFTSSVWTCLIPHPCIIWSHRAFFSVRRTGYCFYSYYSIWIAYSPLYCFSYLSAIDQTWSNCFSWVFKYLKWANPSFLRGFLRFPLCPPWPPHPYPTLALPTSASTSALVLSLLFFGWGNFWLASSWRGWGRKSRGTFRSMNRTSKARGRPRNDRASIVLAHISRWNHCDRYRECGFPSIFWTSQASSSWQLPLVSPRQWAFDPVFAVFEWAQLRPRQVK